MLEAVGQVMGDERGNLDSVRVLCDPGRWR